MWDWDVVASWDDGATWAGWADGEASPGYCGEGGGGIGLGASGHAIMSHHSWLTVSSDGGHNWARHDLPGGACCFEYVRQAGSRSEPTNTWFGLMSAPPPGAMTRGGDGGEAEADDDDDDAEEERQREGLSRRYTPTDKGGVDEDEDEGEDERGPEHVGYMYMPGLRPPPANGDVQYLLTSTDYGANWTWTPLPDTLQAGALVQSPTDANRLFALTESCLAQSKDHGVSWSDCCDGAGLEGIFSQLLVKDSKTMFMLRKGAVPLRTTDAGATWSELNSTAPLFQYGATLDGSISWSGKTLVLHGNDPSAIDRGAYGTVVWRSTNDGDDWIDETGDLVTISPGPGVWYERDFYFVTRGEGVTVKRNFEAA